MSAPTLAPRFTPVDRADRAEMSAAWLALRDAATALQTLQATDGSIPDASQHAIARGHLDTIVSAMEALAPAFPHDADYLAASVQDARRWAGENFGVPDFLDSLVAFQPQRHRIDGVRHLVVFPMYTQNGSPDRHLEALIVEAIWPEAIARLEADYTNRLFVSLRLIDFTPGYDTNSAVLFPETIAMREIPAFTWGAIFQDREAARFRRVTRSAAEITKLELPPLAARMLDDQELTELTFVMWDLIHDRTHMRGDLPFDPFMIKQRMPYFLYSLEELRCDLTAFRECVALEARYAKRDDLDDTERRLLEHARLVQYAVIFDRIFRFAVTGSRVRNYDGLGGQLLFAWLHQRRVSPAMPYDACLASQIWHKQSRAASYVRTVIFGPSTCWIRPNLTCSSPPSSSSSAWSRSSLARFGSRLAIPSSRSSARTPPRSTRKKCASACG